MENFSVQLYIGSIEW